MPWLLKRILTNGLAAAALLGLLGLVFTELATMWLAAGAPNRAAADTTAPVADTIRARVPLLMAAWGLGFVVVSEGLLYLFRGGPPGARSAPRELKAETAEVLLDELLRQADEIRGQGSEGTGASPSLTTRS